MTLEPPPPIILSYIIILKYYKITTNLTAPSTIEVTDEAPFVIDHAVQNLELGHVLL